MNTILRGVRPLDGVLAALLTGLGVLLMVGNINGWEDGARVDSTSWLAVPAFAAATLPVLWRRRDLWAVLGVSAAAMAVHVVAFGWAVRCGAGLPLAFALAYAAGRLVPDRTRSLLALAATAGIQVLVLVRDSAAGPEILPVTAGIGAAAWAVGLVLQRRSAAAGAGAVAAPTYA